MPGHKRERSQTLREKVFARDHGQCLRCGSPATDAHHIRPLAEGGKDELDNQASLCWYCHQEWHLFTVFSEITFEKWTSTPPAYLIWLSAIFPWPEEYEPYRQILLSTIAVAPKPGEMSGPRRFPA